jgi:hypothetical protein
MYAHARTYPSPSLRRSSHAREQPAFFSARTTQHVESISGGVELARAVLAIGNAVFWAALLFLI